MLRYSIGELVDKLAVVHLKIWHIEEKIAEFSDEPTQQQADLLDQVVSLNKLRVDIVDSINEIFEELNE